MDVTKAVAALAPVLMLMACGQGRTPANESAPNSSVSANMANAQADAAEPPALAPADPANGMDASVPPAGPPALTPEAERGVEGARNVLLFFARAIELKRYDEAWALLSPADKRKWSRTAFAALFADLPEATVAVPTGSMEGAAGSSYYTAPVTITGNDRAGRPVRLEGSAVLRRVNDVPGATPAQLRWHFETLTLDWTH